MVRCTCGRERLHRRDYLLGSSTRTGCAKCAQRGRRPSQDVEREPYPVERGVPMPEQRCEARHDPPRYPYLPMGDLRPRDSFLIPSADIAVSITAIRSRVYAAAHDWGIRVALRTTHEGVRVWRIA